MIVTWIDLSTELEIDNLSLVVFSLPDIYLVYIHSMSLVSLFWSPFDSPNGIVFIVHVFYVQQKNESFIKWIELIFHCHKVVNF